MSPASCRSSPASIGVELLPATLAGQSDGRLDPANAVRHLGELGKLSDTCRHRNVLTTRAAGPAASVPPLIRRPDTLKHRVGQAELIGEQPVILA
jgi:hypothetical protein